MSNRWYPIFQKGNPQLRVFLPNFWMRLVKIPEDNLKPNVVQFHVSMGMSQYDIKNYLEKVYNVPVVYARTYIQQGQFKRVQRKGYVVKEDDFKVAFVTLPKDHTFKFPDLFAEGKQDQEIENERKSTKHMEGLYKKALSRTKLRPHVPNWFT